jgi:negative regulator of sigma E activity
MKCESVRAQLTAYLDGELEDDRGSAVRGHLRGCEACRGVAADEAALRDGLRSLPPLDPPASLWAGVQRQLAAAEVADAERPAWRRALARWLPRAPQLGLAGAALAGAIVLVVVKLQQDDTPVQTLEPATKIDPVVIAPDSTAPTPAAPRDDVAQDVTAELAAEPAAITASYASTVRDLLAIANEARASWPDDKRRDFDAQVAALQKRAALATDERPRRESYRKLIRYLQRTVIHDDVALASTGGTP